uniref:Uncharacterized protein n=1 Tax=Plectus sambesii TaxID=2011161 RepID=A0A914W6N9_9BILA
MASGHYHRRWSGSSVSGGAAASNLGGTYKSLSSAVEPSTHGTSWNSVRWNKPSAAYRDHSSRIGSTFSSTKPSYSLSTADRYSSRRSNDYKRPSLDNGPSPGSYASRRSSLQPTTSSTPRYLAPSLLASPNPSNSSSYSPSTNNRYEPSKRYTSPSYSSSRTSSYNYNSPSNNYSTPSNNYSSPTSNYSSALAAALGKAERPWRTRMADSARQRAYGGEATPPTRSSGRTTPRSRRSSASSGDELSTAVASLKNYADSAISNGARYGKKSLGSSTVPTISENIALLSSNGNADNDKRLPTSALRDCYLTKSYPPPTRTSPTPVSPHSSSPLAVSLSTSRDFSSPTPLTKKWPGTQDLQPKSPTLNSSRHSSRPDSPSEPSIIEGESAAKDANDAACFQYSDVDVVPLPSGEGGGGVSEGVEKKAKENGSSQDEPPSVAGSEKQKKRRLRKRTTLDKLSPSPANASGNQSSSDEESRVDSEEARPRRRRRSKARQRETSVEEDASVAIATAEETKKTKKTSAPPAKLQRSVTDVDNGEDDVRTCLDDIEQTFVDTAQLLVNDIDKLVEEALASDNNDTQQSTKSAKANVKKDEKSSSVSLSEVSKKDVEKAAAKVDEHADAPESKAATKPKTVRVPLKPKRTSALKDQTKKEAEDDAKTPVTAPSNNKNKQKATTLEKVADSATKLDAGKESEFKELNGTEQRSEPVAKAPEAVKKDVKPLPPKEVSAKMAFTRPNPELIVEHVLLERVKEECAISLREPCKPLVELFIDVSFQLMGDEQECDINRGMPRASVTHRNLIREPCKRLAVEPPITALALVKKALVSPSSTVRAEITIKVAPKVLAQLRTASSTNRVAAVTEILRRPNSIGRAEIVVRTRGDSNKIGNLSKSGNSKSTPLATARASFAAVPRRGENSAGQQPRTSKDGGLAATGDLPWRSAGRSGERAAVVDSSTFADDDVAAVDELARAEALLSSLAAWERDQQKRRTLGGDQQQQQPLNSSGAGAGRFGVPSAVPIADQRRSLPVVDQRSEQVAKNRTACVPGDVQLPKQQQQQPGEKWRKQSGPSSSIESGVSGAAATKKKRQQTNGALFSPPPTAGALSPFSAVSAATDSPASSSLLLPAPVVRVLQPPRNKQRATITPSRQRLNSTDSQLSYASAASSTASGDKHPPFSRPTPSLSEVDQNMLDLLTLGEQLSGSRASLQTVQYTLFMKWLEDDIKSWTNVNPKPDLLVPCDLPSMLDLDERSVGSASAEVAAINEHDGKQSRRLHPHHAPDLIPRVEVKAKAAPVRRGSNQTQSSTDSARNMIGKAIEKTQQTRKLEAHRLSFPNNAGRSPPEKSHRSFEAYDYLPFQQQKAVSENYYGRIASGAAAVVRGVGANNANSSRHPKSVGSVHSLPESALIRPKAVRAVPPPAQQPAFERQKPNAPLLPDHLLTLDNLVAELDLNTDGMTTSMEMRQSFPTAGIHREEDMLAVPEYSHPRHHEKPMSSSYDRDVKKSQHQRTLDEATNFMNAVAGEYGTRSAGEVMSPYLDKNDELGGQRVDYMRSMFESKNNEEQQPAWRRNVGGGSSKSTPRRPSIPNEDEGNYYEINDLLKPSSPRSNRKAPSDAYPPVPISSLPARPPEKKYINSLPSSSQDLDYDDDGNYDNIPMPISNRVSQRSSPSRIVQPAHQVTASNSNLSKSQAGAKLSQLLRKIGGSGSSSRPPQPASSMIALHKTSHEQSPHPALYKSNSVGYEPWAKDVLNASSGPTPTLDNGKKAGLGKRLKQSLFGSSKRK